MLIPTPQAGAERRPSRGNCCTRTTAREPLRAYPIDLPVIEVALLNGQPHDVMQPAACEAASCTRTQGPRIVVVTIPGGMQRRSRRRGEAAKKICGCVQRRVGARGAFVSNKHRSICKATPTQLGGCNVG